MTAWPTKPLREVCDAKSGNSTIIKGTLPTHNDGSLFPAYSATGQDVFSDGYDFEGEGIVISAVGARCGKCFFARGKWRAIANTHVIIPKKELVNGRFLWYILNDESFWVKGGTAQPFVKVGESLKLCVPVPPLPEQERIVRILDQADELRRLRREADRRTADLIPALFHDMFGDPATNPKGWPKVMFEDAFDDETSRNPKLKQRDYCGKGELPVIDQGQDFVAGYTSDLSYQCRSELPFIVFGDHTRIVKFVEEVCAVGADGTRVFRAKPAFDPRFLSELLALAPLPDLGYSRHMRELKRLRFMRPPLELQVQFSSRASGVRCLIADQANTGLKLDDLFQSLLHRAFVGGIA